MKVPLLNIEGEELPVMVLKDMVALLELTVNVVFLILFTLLFVNITYGELIVICTSITKVNNKM